MADRAKYFHAKAGSNSVEHANTKKNAAQHVSLEGNSHSGLNILKGTTDGEPPAAPHAASYLTQSPFPRVSMEQDEEPIQTPNQPGRGTLLAPSAHPQRSI